MRILCIGDVVGGAGCRFLRSKLPAVKRVKGIDAVICNAGVSLVKLLADTTDGEYRRVMDTNVYGPFCALRAARWTG